MARGWDSKSAVERAGMADVRRGAVIENAPDPERLDLVRKNETILLSRTRVMRELTSTQNPRYRAVLEKALAGLDAQLSVLHRRLAH